MYWIYNIELKIVFGRFVKLILSKRLFFLGRMTRNARKSMLAPTWIKTRLGVTATTMRFAVFVPIKRWPRPSSKSQDKNERKREGRKKNGNVKVSTDRRIGEQLRIDQISSFLRVNSYQGALRLRRLNWSKWRNATRPGPSFYSTIACSMNASKTSISACP